VVKAVPGTTSAYAERITGGFYLDIEPDRAALARYGLSVGEVQDVIATALGGEMVTTTVEGRERFGVIVRYPRDCATDPDRDRARGAGAAPAWTARHGAARPAGEVRSTKGAPAIRTENALLSAYIYVDIRERDIGGYVADAQKAVAEQVKFPPGYYATWSGQFEYMERAIEKLKIVVPLTLLIIFLLLYLNFRPHDRDADRDALGALRAGRRRLADVVAGLQPERGRGRRLHRAGRRRRRDRRGDADLPRPRLGGARAKRAAPPRAACPHRRPVRRDHGRRGRARAAEDDDRGRDHGRPAADHVEHRHRLGGHEPHRRADGRRHDVVDRADAGGDSGDLCAGQVYPNGYRDNRASWGFSRRSGAASVSGGRLARHGRHLGIDALGEEMPNEFPVKMVNVVHQPGLDETSQSVGHLEVLHPFPEFFELFRQRSMFLDMGFRVGKGQQPHQAFFHRKMDPGLNQQLREDRVRREAIAFVGRLLQAFQQRMELAVLGVDFGDADIERNGYFVKHVPGHNRAAPSFRKIDLITRRTEVIRRDGA
jgi:hypothetical protein